MLVFDEAPSEYSELSYDEDTLLEGPKNPSSILQLNKLIRIGGTRSKLSESNSQ